MKIFCCMKRPLAFSWSAWCFVTNGYGYDEPEPTARHWIAPCHALVPILTIHFVWEVIVKICGRANDTRPPDLLCSSGLGWREDFVCLSSVALEYRLLLFCSSLAHLFVYAPNLCRDFPAASNTIRLRFVAVHAPLPRLVVQPKYPRVLFTEK